jgi:hypothetical protein
MNSSAKIPDSKITSTVSLKERLLLPKVFQIEMCPTNISTREYRGISLVTREVSQAFKLSTRG